MGKKQYACRNCKMLTTEKECPNCKSKDLSTSWKGIIVVNDPKESKIAKLLGITEPGKYALFIG